MFANVNSGYAGIGKTLVATVDEVKNNVDICNEIKDFFNEIMVDEYQDTSSIQEEFISYISNNNLV